MNDLSRFNNINERGQPKCGVWSPYFGPCIRNWPHTHHDNPLTDLREEMLQEQREANENRRREAENEANT